MSSRRPPIDPFYMDVAIQLARQSRPSPNPRVGAVVVAAGRIVGQGHHESPGNPHAEVVALEQARESARGADIYVTLEPCCHFGRTPPCADAIVDSGIARVIIGMTDPDLRVRGGGIDVLERAGIEVVTEGPWESKCRRLLFGYMSHRVTGRPGILLKTAMTLDGNLATHTGSSKWITGPEARRRAHELRADCDAVLVGIETVLADDPLLTVRDAPGITPLRIVLDSSLRIPPDSALIQSASPQAPVIVAHTSDPTSQKRNLSSQNGVEVLTSPQDRRGGIDLERLAIVLGSRGILSVLVEGGSKIHGAFLASRLADRLCIFIAPKIIGQGLCWNGLAGVDLIEDATRLEDVESEQLGDDLLIDGYLVYPQDDDS